MEYVITDSVGLDPALLSSFHENHPATDVEGFVGLGTWDLLVAVRKALRANGKPGLVGATIQVETKDGEVVGRFAYYVRREP
jgi:hypothetical protein